MFTIQQAIRAARRLLRAGGIRIICLDVLKGKSETMNANQFRELVLELVDDTFYWEI